ncbi:MAG TPA: BON domain-containing protein [Candidatus Angelobacter sp.]|nr:BON domain-containing protein [Candidatus Angelobacter sp.]
MKKAMQWVLIAALTLGSASLATALPAEPDNDSRLSVAQSQDRIVRDVRHELVMLPWLSVFDNLNYKVDGSTVTLLGEVRNAVLKDEAQAAVKHIEGVEQVNNNIEILPVSFNDDRIRRQMARELFRDPRLFVYSLQSVPPIHIVVKNGHVTLEGVVRDQGDKDVAGIRANSVPGVFSVENNLQVERQQARK